LLVFVLLLFLLLFVLLLLVLILSFWRWRWWWLLRRLLFWRSLDDCGAGDDHQFNRTTQIFGNYVGAPFQRGVCFRHPHRK
jgi:hypothetical protein